MNSSSSRSNSSGSSSSSSSSSSSRRSGAHILPPANTGRASGLSRRYRHASLNHKQQEDDSQRDTDEAPTAAVTWPIILAIIPTLGAFFAGSADIWSDLVMGLLILYYVYKWMTVPWAYYEEARTRRIVHQNTVARQHRLNDERYRKVMDELRRHEQVGLMWVLLSPCIVAYSLRFSRYFLTNHDRYMSYFNVTIFLLAAHIRPCRELLLMFHGRTQELRSALQFSEHPVDVLKHRVDRMGEEMDELYDALVAKKEVTKIATDIQPALERIEEVTRQMERDEGLDRQIFEDRYRTVDKKANELNQLILYRIEQDQIHTSQRTLVSLMLLPVRIVLWITQYTRSYLPFQPHHSTRSSVASPGSADPLGAAAAT